MVELAQYEYEEDAALDEDAELVEEIRENLKTFSDNYRNWRVAARESYDFFAGNQWSDTDKQTLEDQGRPAVVFNRVARTINAVTGLELQNRQEADYKPITVDDTGVTDLANAAAKWCRSNCDAEDEESEAFQDTLICGVGGTETMMDYSTDPDGMVVEERADPFELAWDSKAKKRNCDDKKWVARSKKYSKREFAALCKSLDKDIEDVTGDELGLWSDEAGVLIGHADDEYAHEDSGDPIAEDKDECYTVIKYQYVREVAIYRVATQGQLIELTKEEFEAVEPQLKQLGLKSVKQMKKEYKQILICRSYVLSHEDAPISGFTIRLITGLRDRNTNTWFGLVELMKDPQRWANKWLSQIQYILNSNAKGGILFESDTFVNPKKAKADYNKPDTWIEVNKGAITEGKIMPKPQPQYPEGIDRLLQQALSAINDVPGVNVEMLGIADRNQPGIIEDSRKEAGVTILASFFDALRRFRKEQGRVLLQFIIEYISDGRLVRLDGANGKYVPLLKDSLAAKYDIMVDDAPTSPNMKQKVFGVVSQMLQMALQAGIPIPPEILEYSPLPSALVEKWMKLIEDQKNDPNIQKKSQQADQAFAANLEKVESEAVKNKTQAQLNEAKMRKELDPSTYGASEMDLQVERTKAGAQVVKAQAEIQKSQLQIKNELIKTAFGLQKHAVGSVNNQPTEAKND